MYATVLKVALLAALAAQVACTPSAKRPAGGRRALARSGSPATDSSPVGWQSLCAAAEHAEFPESDAPNANATAQLKFGDARRFYYGIDVPIDYVRAREAARMERDDDGDGFAASTILMMIYANGFGVTRNLDLAIKLACEYAEGQPLAEVQGRISHLDGMRTAPRGLPFDFCDDVGTGELDWYCAQLAEQRRDAQQRRALAALSEDWPVEQRARLDLAQAALNRFAELHAEKERDLSDVDRGKVLADAEEKLKQAFLGELQRFEQGKFPSHSEEDYRRAAEELNRVYSEALAEDYSETTITPAGIQATEKAWITYREAWLALAALRYAQVSKVVFNVWLTRQRTEQLRRM